MWSSLLPEINHDGDDHDNRGCSDYDNCGGSDLDDGGHDNCDNNDSDGGDELTRQSLISPGNVRTW